MYLFYKYKAIKLVINFLHNNDIVNYLILINECNHINTNRQNCEYQTCIW